MSGPAAPPGVETNFREAAGRGRAQTTGLLQRGRRSPEARALHSPLPQAT